MKTAISVMKSLKKSKEKKGFSTTLKNNKKTTIGWYEGESDPASIQQNKLWNFHH